MEEQAMCFICERTGIGLITVLRGMEALKKASIERNDGKFNRIKDLNFVKVHAECRKDYTRQNSIASYLKQQSSSNNASLLYSPKKKSLRSSSESFNFSENCIFCEKEANIEAENRKKPKYRQVISHITVASTKNHIMEMLNSRNDDKAKKVKHRIVGIFDLTTGAKYHKSCYDEFYRGVSINNPGRPKDKNISSSMDKIFAYLENTDECQFTIKELLDSLDEDDYRPDQKTVKAKLMERYGEDVIISTSSTSATIVCFRDTGHKVLSDAWYEEKMKCKEEERLRVVLAAAEIIREDIRGTVYETSHYPSLDNLAETSRNMVPQSLSVMLNGIIIKSKKAANETLNTKCTTIAHAIISATRPRSFLSPLQLGLSNMLHRRYGSRRLVDILSAFGFCASYHETSLFESSALFQATPAIQLGSFTQFIFDNADFNINTIDGLNTFHSMGAIQCISPSKNVAPLETFPRLSTIPPVSKLASLGKIDLREFNIGKKIGLKSIVIEDLHYTGYFSNEILPTKPDLLWMVGKSKGIPFIPGWSGFMLTITSQMKYETTKVMCLPFINASPTRHDTIYTSLLLAVEKSQALERKTCIVTFDQPLYIKARDIVASCDDSSDVSRVVVRLGGFHTLMSFMGSVGYIMDGSGLKELMSTIYAPTSVDKMLSGHAYARALRGHFLVQAALASIIIQDIDIDSAMYTAIIDTLDQFTIQEPSFKQINDTSIFEELLNDFDEKLQVLEGRGATAKLWVLYFRMITIVKQFLQAERMGDWNLHLKCIARMIPFFHASGHLQYAKSAHVYLQDMIKLESIMDKDEFKQFTDDGYFTIRRSEKFWSGIWSDMTIEQTLMRAMKTSGGLTRGRGLTDSVLAKWTLGMTLAYTVVDRIEEFCNLPLDNDEQHVELRDSRISRDETDLKLLSSWLQSHDPFPHLKKIMSIASGLTGNDKVNCHNAYEIGIKEMNRSVGQNVKDIVLHRKNRVLPLTTKCCGLKLYDTVHPIDPLLIFQRMTLVTKSDEDLKTYFSFELAPFPLSLFDECGMRKTKKSSLYNVFNELNEGIDLTKSIIILDGGFLLHRSVWSINETFEAVCEKYTAYVKNHFGSNVIVVFDGYNDNAMSTKSAEHHRRSQKHVSTDIHFDENTVITVQQDKFLSNNKNKARLIKMLSSKLQENNILVKQAPGDADVLIVVTAIGIARSETETPVVVVGEDVDLVVLLTALTPQNNVVYFFKPGKGKIKSKLYSSASFQGNEECKSNILFLHAFSGCDSTSCFFGKGKTVFLKLLQKREDLNNTVSIFNDPEASHESITEAGELFTLALYGARTNEKSINNFRFITYKAATRKNRPVNLASLPPTKEALSQHSCRAFHQIQEWRGNKLPPENWGWKVENLDLTPTTTILPPAPDSILKMIFCNCKKGCKSACSCKKGGLKCNAACGSCQGISCFNSYSFEDNEDSAIENEINTSENATYSSEPTEREFDIFNAGEMSYERPPAKKTKFEVKFC